MTLEVTRELIDVVRSGEVVGRHLQGSGISFLETRSKTGVLVSCHWYSSGGVSALKIDGVDYVHSRQEAQQVVDAAKERARGFIQEDSASLLAKLRGRK